MSIFKRRAFKPWLWRQSYFSGRIFPSLKRRAYRPGRSKRRGKSTFMNIITGKLMPDEGKVEWAKNVNVGYLDQHTVLEKGMTIREVLKAPLGPSLKWKQT